ncbi:MAG: hypothetical protein IJA10_01700 [Lachnospiraceae bacterium]|nr:hypothetical protein [Lachnospiraceae bacterium]
MIPDCDKGIGYARISIGNKFISGAIFPYMEIHKVLFMCEPGKTKDFYR